MTYPVWQFKFANVLFILLFLFPPVLMADHENKLDLSLGGRIKFDTIYNANSVGGAKTSKSDLAFSPRAIPVPNTSRNSFDTNLRESRIWASLSLPVSEETVLTYIEFDLFDTRKDASGHTHVANKPRLRHLYAVFNKLTIGKTYTTFANVASYPEINDANGPVGNSLIRQELIRYHTSLAWGEVFLALEKPESTFITASGNRLQINDDPLPDIIGKIKFSGLWGDVSLAGLIRQIDSNNTLMTGIDDAQWGGGLSIAGRLFISPTDNLRFAISYGNAIGRYISFNAFNDATIDNTGRINLSEIIGSHLAYQHWWTSTLRSSFITGIAYASQDEHVTPATIDKFFASASLNLLWSPRQDTTVGIEWLHGYRELENDNNGHLDRIQFSAIYKF